MPVGLGVDPVAHLGTLSMLRGIGLTVSYVFLAVFAGSLLGWLLSPWLDFEPGKVISRAVLLFMAVGLVVMWRLSQLNARELGFVPRPERLAGYLGKGFALGLLTLAPVVLFFFVVGFRVRDTSVDLISTDFALQLLSVFVGAVLVGLFEETLFRGVLFGALRRSAGVVVAVVVSSVIYAGVHFLRTETELQDVQWYSGLLLAWQGLGSLGAALSDWPSALALALLGALFCWLRLWFGLWICIALHAAWVFGIRLLKEVTVRDVVNPYVGWVGDYDNFVGHLVSIWLIFIFVVLLLYRNWVQAASAHIK